MAEAAVSQASRCDRFPHGNKVWKHRKEPFRGFRWRFVRTVGVRETRGGSALLFRSRPLGSLP